MSFDEEEEDEDENSSSSSQLNSNTRPSSAASKKSIRVSEDLLCLVGWQTAVFTGLGIRVGNGVSGERMVSGFSGPGSGPRSPSGASLGWALLSSHPAFCSLQLGQEGEGSWGWTG